MATLLLTTCFCGAAEAPAKIPIILDTDIGTDIDDAFALALIINSPEFELLGTGAHRRQDALGSRRKVAAGSGGGGRARAEAKHKPSSLGE
jgi:hypothetical protein